MRWGVSVAGAESPVESDSQCRDHRGILWDRYPGYRRIINKDYIGIIGCSACHIADHCCVGEGRTSEFRAAQPRRLGERRWIFEDSLSIRIP